MAGGIKAWQGLTAAGLPEAGMAFFTAAAGTDELIALAWLLEEGSRRFYSALAAMRAQPEVAGLFGTLAEAETNHKSSLLALYRDLTGKAPGPDFPRGLSAAQDADDRMEGSVRVSEALTWAGDKETADLLDLCMSLEADSYDLYIKMGRSVPGEKAKKVFEKLVAEEKAHLARMADMLDGLDLQGPDC